MGSSTRQLLWFWGHCFFKLLRLLRPGFQRVLPEIARSGGWILLPPRSTGLREPGKAGVFFVAVRLSSSGFYTPCLVRFLHTFILFECLWLFHCKRDPPLQICRHECKLISNIYIYIKPASAATAQQPYDTYDTYYRNIYNQSYIS